MSYFYKAFIIFSVFISVGCNPGGLRGDDPENRNPNEGAGISGYLICQLNDTQEKCESVNCIWDPSSHCLSPTTSFCSSATIKDSCNMFETCLWNDDYCVKNHAFSDSWVENFRACKALTNVDSCLRSWSYCVWNAGACTHNTYCLADTKEMCQTKLSCVWNEDSCILNARFNPFDEASNSQACEIFKNEEACGYSWAFCQWDKEKGCKHVPINRYLNGDSGKL